MTWIRTIPYEEAKGTLKQLYDRVQNDGKVDNILMAHSLRPQSLTGHMTLYKNVLHHSENKVPKWFLETLGIYTSLLNGCDYCVDHHFTGLIRLVGEERAYEIRKALVGGEYAGVFDESQGAMLRYCASLTQDPGALEKTLVDEMLALGVDHGIILEVNQVVSYFAYANRTVLGLGVSTDGDVLGLSPNAGDGDWNHS